MFPSVPSTNHSLVRHWLLLAIAALAVAGVFSVLLVLLRTPSIEAIIPYHDFFHTALIVHVDLSVLVWMLAMSAMLWSMIVPYSMLMVGRAAFGVAVAGMVIIAVSAFIGEAKPLINNYIPVLQNPLFFLGLSLFGCAILLQAIATIVQKPPLKNGLYSGIYSSAVITLIALLCFVLSYYKIQGYVQHNTLEIQHFYELLFWAGGHVLQFTYTQGMIIAWLILAAACGITVPAVTMGWVLFINLLVVLPLPLVMGAYSIDSNEYLTYFTDHMRYAGGIAPLVVVALLLRVMIKSKSPALLSSPQGMALCCSVFLFGAGGVLAHMIQGANVTIPAHYHGSIIAVTLAFMGLVYHLLSQLGYRAPSGRLPVWQLGILCGGQFLHISGLAWSGGYGVLRKTPGEVISLQAKMGMGLMGLGGVIAIVGGLLFVVIAVRAISQTVAEKR